MSTLLQRVEGADQFCGLGGFSAGFLEACHELSLNPKLQAINHWPTAIDTHRLNHPGVSHLCENLDNVEPRKVITSGRLDILLSSPECTHHSNARGGKPMSDQSRASAWHVLRWCEALRVENVLVENVKEFQSWGPLNAKGRPMQSKKGELFKKFCECLESMGYYVDYRVLNSADFGAATARHRLFIQATRRRRPRWPEKTHSEKPDLFGSQRYRAAREIIDWSQEGQSIFGRKKPLSAKTLKRIEAGLKKFSGVEFVIPYRGERDGQSPRCHSLDAPMPTVCTANGHALVEPFLVVLRNNGNGRSLDKPAPALCAGGGHLGLCEPFIVPVTHGGGEERAHGLDNPLPTVTGAKRGELALCEPYLVKMYGTDEGIKDIDSPLPTLTTGRNRMYLAEPYLVQYYGNSGATACGEPLPTVTTRDRFGLCEPQPIAIYERDGVEYALMDIRFRMLQPHELAAAMGLDGYKFPDATTKQDKTKMIGNAVEKNTSRALCRAVLQ